MRRVWGILFLVCMFAGGVSLVGATAELELPDRAEAKFAFDAKGKKLSGSVEGLELKEAMAKLAAVTGWKVFVDPAAERRVKIIGGLEL